jgi:hypothetical protein
MLLSAPCFCHTRSRATRRSHPHARPCSALKAVRRWPSLAACPCWAARSAPPTPQSAQATSVWTGPVLHLRCALHKAAVACRVHFYARPHVQRSTTSPNHQCRAPLPAQASTHPLARPPRCAGLVACVGSTGTALQASCARLCCCLTAHMTQPSSAAGCSICPYAKKGAQHDSMHDCLRPGAAPSAPPRGRSAAPCTRGSPRCSPSGCP